MGFKVLAECDSVDDVAVVQAETTGAIGLHSKVTGWTVWMEDRDTLVSTINALMQIASEKDGPTESILDTVDHLDQARLWMLNGDTGDQSTDAQIVIAHASIAQAQRLNRIADALEKLTGAMSESGSLFDVRVFEAYPS